jgi:Fe-S-cluster containining protein
LFLEKEAERISKVTSKPIEAFACRIIGHEPYLYEMKKDKEGKCVFLEHKTCTIYASRPLICHYYPFELKAERNEIFLFSPTNECPGIGVGEVLKESYFRNLFRLARRLFS